MIKSRIITVLPSSSSQQSEGAKSDHQSTKKLTFDRRISRDAAHALRITTSDDFGTMPVLAPSKMLCIKISPRTLGLYLRPERYIGSSKAGEACASSRPSDESGGSSVKGGLGRTTGYAGPRVRSIDLILMGFRDIPRG